MNCDIILEASMVILARCC